MNDKIANKKKAPTKSCPDCQQDCHARLATCKKCGFVFYKKKKSTIEDWQSLKSGDHVRVVGRSGSYYIKSNGDKIYFTNAGIYCVRDIHKDGLTVIGTGRQSHGYEFLYMGDEVKSSMLDNLYNAPHKLVCVSFKRKGES
tara:strand:- start:475 stop:897 length:423 start_codon:yes stop_codon:yes gene_type:complete